MKDVKRSIRTDLLAVLAVLAITLSAPDAQAGTYWSSPGGSCVPSDVNIQANDYAVSSGSIVHTAASTAAISIYCGISENQGAANPTILRANWSSSLTTDASNFVTAYLYRKTIGSGTLTEIKNVGGSGWSAGISGTTDTFVHTFNFATYFYYVRVIMDRSLTTNSLSIRGVALEN